MNGPVLPCPANAHIGPRCGHDRNLRKQVQLWLEVLTAIGLFRFRPGVLPTPGAAAAAGLVLRMAGAEQGGCHEIARHLGRARRAFRTEAAVSAILSALPDRTIGMRLQSPSLKRASC